MQTEVKDEMFSLHLTPPEGVVSCRHSLTQESYSGLTPTVIHNPNFNPSFRVYVAKEKVKHWPHVF